MILLEYNVGKMAAQTTTQTGTTMATQPAGNTRTTAEEWIAANIN
jgi:hypothetical protein